MMRRRVGRPGLVGTVARTAVVAGTATAVSGGMQRRAASKDAQAQAAEAQQQQQMADQAAAQMQAQAPAAPPVDKMAELKQLGELKASGVLTDAEFEAEKAKLLAM